MRDRRLGGSSAFALAAGALQLAPVVDGTPCGAESESRFEGGAAGREVAAERPAADSDPFRVAIGSRGKVVDAGGSVSLGLGDAGYPA